MIHDLIFFAIDLGTTWTQEMVWCIMNNLDFKAAKESILEKRVPYFEYFVVIFNNVHKLEVIILMIQIYVTPGILDHLFLQTWSDNRRGIARRVC